MALSHMGEYTNLLTLPNDPLLEICSYLDFSDLSSFSQVCKRFQELTSFDRHWKYLCKKHWLLDVCPEGCGWQLLFVQNYKEYGKYIHVYGQIKTAWSQIEDFTAESCPSIFNSLRGGLSEEELDELESKLPEPLPPAVRLAYRIHDGQMLHVAPGLMGSMAFQGHFGSEHLLPLQLAIDTYQKDGHLQGCMQLTSHVTSPQYLCISEDGGHELGQVFYPCFRSYNPDVTIDTFISGKSFLSWFTTYAQELSDGRYSLAHGHIFRFTRNGDIAKTDSINVSVETYFMHNLSLIHHPDFLHVYRITMEMDRNASESESCRLETRHWYIIDEDGKTDEVHGAGVVGEFPVMTPGSRFSWTSCTTFHTTYGSMRGHFTMINLKNGQEIEIECPEFHMRCLPYTTLDERKQKALAKKKNK